MPGNRGAGVHAHHAIGHAVGFLFFGVARVRDGQLRMYEPSAQELLHSLISRLLLQRQNRIRCGRVISWRLAGRRLGHSGPGFFGNLRNFHVLFS
jgi:hypothetical protein